MSGQNQSASTPSFASASLPPSDVIALPAGNRNAPRGRAFTKVSVGKLHCPAGKQEALFWDASCGGFGLRALASGRRTWIYQYRDDHKRTRRIALGDVSAVSLEAARAAARQRAASVARGANPSVQRKEKSTAVTVLHVLDQYLRHARARQRPRSYEQTERHLRLHAAPLHHDRAEAVRRSNIATLLQRVADHSGPVAANRLRAALSALWTWGLRTGLIETESNPVAFTIRNVEKPRDRILSNAEIAAIWAATEDGHDYSRIVRLCLLTGCRRDEIGGLRWEEVQADRILIAGGRMKGATSHEVPLLPMISRSLPERVDENSCLFGRSGNGFSGWSKGKELLDTKLQKLGCVVPWRLHDIRRTFSTRLHDAGVEPLIVEALLAHKQQGVAAVYNRASFRDAKRRALESWHSMLRDILEANERALGTLAE